MPDGTQGPPPVPSLLTVMGEWGRIGCIGFGGPPAHIALLRRLCVQDRAWIAPAEFEDGIASTNLLPGPASTQLAIFCGWRVPGAPGAVVGGLCFIVPGLVLVLALSALFLTGHPPSVIRGAAAGAGSAVAAVAVQAAVGLVPASRRRAHRRGQPLRWLGYLLAGAVAATRLGPYLVLVLIACGLVEILLRRPPSTTGHGGLTPPLVLAAPVVAGGLGRSPGWR